jgi:hypothetical protein
MEREQQIIMVASETLISEPAPSLISPIPVLLALITRISARQLES